MGGKKNTVTLTFAGDSDQLEKSFDNIGSAAKEMDADVGKSTRSLDGLGEHADQGETRLLGLKDSVDGFSTVLKGPGEQGMASFIQGLADMASGVANFIVPFAKMVGSTVAGWLGMGTAATEGGAAMATGWTISLGPALLVVAAIAAIIAIGVLLVKNWDTISAAVGKAWDFIKNAAMGAFNWIKDHWPLILAIITGPIGLAVLAVVKNWDRIKSAFGAVMGAIKSAATSAKDWIVDKFNAVLSFFLNMPGKIRRAFAGLGTSLVDAIRGFWNRTIGGKGFGGQKFGPVHLPRIEIPFLAAGGIVTGPTLAMLGEAGPEAVVPLNRGLGGGPAINVTINVAGSIRSDRDLVKLIRDEFARGGFR